MKIIMIRLIICFVLIILKTVVADLENENPQVLLNCKNTYIAYKKYTVDKNKPIRLILKNCNAKHVLCHNHYFIKNDKFQAPISFDVNAEDNIINVTNVIDAMSTRWSCAVLEEYHGGMYYEYYDNYYTAIKFLFDIHIKGAKMVNITVNLMNLTFEKSGLSAEDNDGESHYTYKDGEIIDYVCSRNGKSETLKLTYYDGNGTLLYQTKKEGAVPQHFRSILRSYNNNAYIICTLTSNDTREEYNYMTTFIQRDLGSDPYSKEKATKISVNGLELVPVPSNDNDDRNIDIYQYKYIEGEVLNITCEKRKPISGNLELYFPENSNFSSDNVKLRRDRIMVALNTSEIVIHTKTLTCAINNSNVQKIFAKIIFFSDLPKKGVRLLGLPLKNVEYQHNSYGNQWIVHYQYRENETLRLSCVHKYEIPDNHETLQWRFDGQIIKTTPYSNTNISTESTTKDFILLERHNESIIECNSIILNETISTAQVILHLKPVSAEENGERTDMEKLFIILGASFGVLIAIITTVCLTCWWNKTKQVELIENAYENISFQIQSPVPEFPSPWENYYHDSHYSRIDENAILDNLAYSGDSIKPHGIPNSRTIKTPSENHYTEIDEYFYPKNVSGGGRNTSLPPINSNNRIQVLNQEYSNNVIDSTQNITGYDVLRRSNLMNCDDEKQYNNSTYLR